MIYFVLILSFFLVLIPTVISYRKDRTNEAAIVLASAIIGAFLSLCTGYSAHNQSVRNSDSANAWNARFVNLQTKTLDTANTIIDSLKIAVTNSRKLIKSNDTLLTGQNTNLKKLDDQLKLSTKIQKNVNASSKKFINALAKTSEKINNNLTGGKGFCKILINTVGTQSAEMGIVNLSDNAIPNVKVSAEYYSKSEKCPFRIIHGYTIYDSLCIMRNIGEVTIPLINIRDTIPMIGSQYFIGNTQPEAKFIIRFNLPNQIYWQLLIFRVDGFKIRQASVLLKVENNRRNIFYYENSFSKTFNWNAAFPRSLDFIAKNLSTIKEDDGSGLKIQRP